MMLTPMTRPRENTAWALRSLSNLDAPVLGRPQGLHGQHGTSFADQDVADLDEARAPWQEVVHFLKNPEMYRRLGAHLSKGVLLVGPPGTGKTLQRLARQLLEHEVLEVLGGAELHALLTPEYATPAALALG